MNKNKIKISGTLSLPIEFVTSTHGILAKKRSGKSYAAQVLAEELLAAHQQVIAFDPTGAWWGLRSSADGKEAGFPIAVLGGEHGDVPLESTAGEVIANAVVNDRFSAVIDTSLFSVGEEQRFAAAFLSTLYRKNRQPMHLFVDEADVFAPQKPFGEEAKTLGAMQNVVRRGGIRGIGCTLITQRPQVLNKDVLSQVDMLTVLRMNHPKDLGAIDVWVSVHGDPAAAKQMIESLPALPVGDAWIWAPAQDIFERVTVRRKTTFDSGRTPKAGQQVAPPKVLAEVDIARLGATIAATVERVKADDPKTLKAKVAELEKQLAAKSPAKVQTKTVEKPVIKPADLARMEQICKRLEARSDLLDAALSRLGTEITAIRGAAAQLRHATTPTNRELAAAHFANDGKVTKHIGKYQVRVPAAIGAQQHPPVRKILTPRADSQSLPVGEEAVLRALIQFPDGLRRQQLSVLTGYSRSTRDKYIQLLGQRGFVEVHGDRVAATEAGANAMPDAEPLPTGKALQDWWLPRLPQGEGLILEQLIALYPDAGQREDLSERTGYSRSTRDKYIQLLAAKQLVVDVGRGAVKASDTLFEVSP